MTERTVGRSPQTVARTGGLLYLVIIATALFAEGFVRGRLVVSGDAAATAQNIIAAQTLFRAGLAADLVNCALDVAVAVILYTLLKPVSQPLALLAALLRVAADTILGCVGLLQLAASVILAGGDYLNAYSSQQIEGLAYLFIKLHGLGYGISIIFFGFSCCILGLLIYRSGYFPRLIGFIISIAGICYLFDSFAGILAPSFAKILFPWPLLPSFISELALCLWLIVKGVNMLRWQEVTLPGTRGL